MISADGCLDGECEALICSLARMIYRNFLYPNAVSLSKKETVELIKRANLSASISCAPIAGRTNILQNRRILNFRC